MKFIEKIPQEEKDQYETIFNWTQYAKLNVLDKNHSIKISQKIILDEIVFTREYKHSFTFENCYFAKSITFDRCIFHGSFLLLECFVEGVICNAGSPTFHNGLNFGNLRCERIQISNGTYSQSYWRLYQTNLIQIQGGEFSDLQVSIDGNNVEEIIINGNLISGEITISSSKKSVKNIILQGTAKKLSITVEDIALEYLRIYNYVNLNRLKISNIGSLPQGRIFISQSYLGKTEFNSIDFNNFSWVVFEDSQLVDCNFNNVNLSPTFYGASAPDKKEQDNNDSVRYNRKSRETFRQLKYAMSKQGDSINEQKFHAIEMGYYFEMLSWKKDFWTKSIVFLSHLTSEFGQSIWRPLLFLFSIHTALFLTLLISKVFPGVRFSFSFFNITAFSEAINQFFYLINPVRPFDKTLFHGGWIVIDLLMRISSSYMIYNVIRASRRFIK